MFTLGPIDDLLAPQNPSSGRALASLARRRTFEELKGWLALGPRAGAESPRLERARAALAHAFALRLPGDPHAIASAIADPAVGAPLRRGLAARDADETRWLELGIWRLLAAIGEPVVHLAAGDRPDDLTVATGSIHDHAIEGALALRTGDSALLACVGLEAARAEDDRVGSIRTALDRIRAASLPIRTDLDRFAARLVIASAPPWSLPRWAVGLGVVPPEGGTDAIVTALVATVVTHKLHVLLGATPSTAAIESFQRLACDTAVSEVRRSIRLRAPGSFAGEGLPSRVELEGIELTALPDVLAPVHAEILRLQHDA